MDPRLAELYGTNQVEAESVAADELAEKLASANELDVTELSDDEAESLAQEILTASAAEETEEEETTEEPAAEEKTAESDESEKVAEAQADYLGRVMAHAFTQELRSIEKTSSDETDLEKDAGKVSDALNAGKNFLKTKGGDLAAKAKSKATEAGMKGRTAARKGDLFARKHHKKFMGGAAAAGVAAGAAGKKKQSAASDEKVSAFDTLAHQRAIEILEANGIKIEETAPEAAEEKTAAPETDNRYELLAQAVDSRAWEMLTEAGYAKSEEEETEE